LIGWAAAFLLLAAAGAAGCRAAALRRSLAPGHAEFLAQTRYIMTRSEEKIFLELPASERDAFIAEFWRRRDPDPYSEENEFRTEYYSRLETANQLFAREGKPGWMTDRGRIHILFGPPFDRLINPIDGGQGERCSEVWYYGAFPVVFRDPDCSGHLVLETYDLSAIREYNLSYMHQLSGAQGEAQKTYFRKREPLKFRSRARIVGTRAGRVEGLVSLNIPYAGLWFETPQVGSLVTTLEVEISLRDTAGASLWSHREEFEVRTREEFLERAPDDSFVREIPFALDRARDELLGKKLKFEIRLTNRTGGEEARRTLDFPDREL
jgi:GWxTD domain-containing protein